MAIKKLKILSLSLLIFVIILLTACMGSSPTPPDHYYRLAPLSHISKLSQPILSGTLAVKRLRADGLQGERAIVYVEHKHRLELQRYHYHHWSQTPNRLIQDHMVEYFRLAKIANKVIRYDAAPNHDGVLSGELLRFERLLNKNGPIIIVKIELRYNYQKNKLWNKEYNVQVKADGPTLHASIEAFSKALEIIYQKFISDIQSLY